MYLSRVLFIVAFAAVADGAALVTIPTPDPAKFAAFEPNRGQAKPEILFLGRGRLPLAVTGQSVLISPLGVRQTFASGNPYPPVSFDDPLPGTANWFSGADPQKWITGIPRYRRALLRNVYLGIDAQFDMDANGQVSLRFIVGPAGDPNAIVFEVPEARDILLFTGGSLRVNLGPSRNDPILSYARPIAFQESPFGRFDYTANYERLSATRFAIRVDAPAATAMSIEVQFNDSPTASAQGYPQYLTDAAGTTFVAAGVSDAAGKDDPFPEQPWAGCGGAIGVPIACSDVGVYKFSPSGELVFVSYLAGRTREDASAIRFGLNGTLVVTGNTDSPDFPVSSSALQRVYSGPPAVAGGSSGRIEGDYYAAILDASNGTLRQATYFGGPNADRSGETAIGADGSLYFIPKWLVQASKAMPVTPGALQSDCPNECLNGYAAHISPSLDRLLYGTYLPGTASSTAKLHTDGSVYFAGWSGPGFPVSANAFQPQVAGREDAFVARLDPSGTKLLFGTYIGGTDTDWILRTAVAPDGSVWAHVSSFVQCCINISYRLVHLDSQGQKIIAELPIDIGDIATDRNGNLLATTYGRYEVGLDALLSSPCASGLAYIRLGPQGELRFATYLPGDPSYDFVGTSARGAPILTSGNGHFEVVEGQSMGMLVGCLVDAASFGNSDVVSPGAIVTLFGSRMGPTEGVAFQLQNGRLPDSLGGTRVLVNGEPVPLLYASYWQINAILSYSIPVGSSIEVRVERNGVRSEQKMTPRVLRAQPSIFHRNTTVPYAGPPAAALNADGTLNSPSNPAKKGSIIALFGTGGGATVPPSLAGEVTPLELRKLENEVIVQVPNSSSLPVIYAGAAPGQVAGVIQVNVKLPDATPEVAGYPRGIVPISLIAPGISQYPARVTIAVEP